MCSSDLIVDRVKNYWHAYKLIDLSGHAVQNEFLEGTGSIVFDHKNKIAYACASPRTNEKLFRKLCDLLNYHPVYFHAFDEACIPVYHTNVMMCIGNGFAVLCKESITDEREREMVCSSLSNGGYDLIEISMHQMKNFAGNMLMLQNKARKQLLVLSERAYQSFAFSQIERMKSYCELVSVSIPTIEMVGGGSARCMLAEVFLEKKPSE